MGNYLKVIKLDDCFKNIKYFLPLIKQISKICVNLEELAIYNAINFIFTDDEFNHITKLSNLKKFEFVNCQHNINHQIINDVLLALPKLEWLNLSHNWSFNYSCIFPLIIPIFDVVFPSLHTLILNNIGIGRNYSNNKQKKNQLCRCCRGNCNEWYKRLFIYLFTAYPALKRLEIRNYNRLTICNNYCYEQNKHFYHPIPQYEVIKQCLLQLNRRLDILSTSRICLKSSTDDYFYRKEMLNKEYIECIKESMITSCINKEINLDSSLEDILKILKEFLQYNKKFITLKININEFLNFEDKNEVVLVVNFILSMLIYKRLDEMCMNNEYDYLFFILTNIIRNGSCSLLKKGFIVNAIAMIINNIMFRRYRKKIFMSLF